MEEKKQNEINLLELIQLFFRGLKKLGLNLLNLLGNTLRLLYRHKILTCIILAFGVAYGFYSGRPENRIYRAEAMAILNGSLAQTVKEVSRQLENASPASHFTSLSARLDLPYDVADNIVSISSFYVIDFLNDSTPDMVDFRNRHSWKDTLNVRMPNRLYFQIRTRDISQIPVFEEAFLNYFNTNARLVGEFEVKKRNLAQEIRLLGRELHRLDSMADISYFRFPEMHVQLHRNTLLVGEQEKQLLYEDMMFVQNKKLRREFEFVNFTAPVVLPTGFIVSPHPERGRIGFMMTYFFFALAISIFLSLFIEHRKCIFNYLQTK